MPKFRSYNTPEELNLELEHILADCEKEGILPTDWVLYKRLNVSLGTLQRWKKMPEFANVMQKITAYSENLLLQQTFQSNGKNNAFSIFLLKQQKYGGYTDIQQTKSDIKVKVNFGGDAEDFK